MSTTGQFSTKNPTIKRILKEAAELSQNPSPDYHAAPLETDLFSWHFTIRGPPAPSPFSNGIYHGQITLPPSYPLKPPNFRFLTPSGRFEVNREICLSISGHHEESWQPAWGIRTALVAIRSFMDSEAGGQLGGMSAAENVRRRLAGESRGWRCNGCGGRTNEEVLKEQEELCAQQEEGVEEERKKREAEMAKEISFAPKSGEEGETAKEATVAAGTALDVSGARSNQATPRPQQQQQQQTPVATPTSTTAAAQIRQAPQRQRQQPLPEASRDVWLDRAIIGIVCALVFMVLRRFS
ncbi:ubiquitin-conjugating enzyme/RWD-like protein [Delphinella strobiligena]|nr:ubiquitin-conjugating enzyme/RWD-like protein [Delphinella strobiligena]